MINVTVTRNGSDGSIHSCRIVGHAEYDVPGKDIVCSAVSAISVGTYNAVEALLGLIMEHRMEHGLFEFTVPDGLDEQAAEKVQLIAESMVIMLQTIETNYSEYIHIIEKKGGRLECYN